MRFKLREKHGIHIEAGKTYMPGQTVESQANLAELFPDKFESLDDPKADEKDGPKTAAESPTGLIPPAAPQGVQTPNRKK